MEGYTRPLAQVLQSVSCTDLEEFRRLGQRDRQLTLKDGAQPVRLWGAKKISEFVNTYRN